ncbi:hypothetical protein [Luteibacter yeojuensis]|uniref:Uncharacterized protein n=1 Tax=Luteibacter yeojuensis TaxID=345309 RepID=A0A7X5QRT3_9GAMM|nr:hypothetical protein [Luteibacter yeojuensis]NID14127.1 hypothetical protein [Luteibacter yeojuensis]
MKRFPAPSIRRLASTFLVFLALFVACAGVQAMSCPDVTDTVAVALYADAGSDPADPGDEGLRLSLEDNNSGLDDSFDVPPEHAVNMPRLHPGRPPGLVPPPHAHARSSELRPPIA